VFSHTRQLQFEAVLTQRPEPDPGRTKVMPTALFTRTVVVAAYLLALLFKGRADLVTGLLAAAIVAVWTVSLCRDRMTRGGRSAPTRGDAALRMR
jgi:hypothetical protein